MPGKAPLPRQEAGDRSAAPRGEQVDAGGHPRSGVRVPGVQGVPPDSEGVSVIGDWQRHENNGRREPSNPCEHGRRVPAGVCDDLCSEPDLPNTVCARDHHLACECGEGNDRKSNLPDKDWARFMCCRHGRGLGIPCDKCPAGARLCPQCEWPIPSGDDFCIRCYEKVKAKEANPVTFSESPLPVGDFYWEAQCRQAWAERDAYMVRVHPLEDRVKELTAEQDALRPVVDALIAWEDAPNDEAEVTTRWGMVRAALRAYRNAPMRPGAYAAVLAEREALRAALTEACADLAAAGFPNTASNHLKACGIG